MRRGANGAPFAPKRFDRIASTLGPTLIACAAAGACFAMSPALRAQTSDAPVTPATQANLARARDLFERGRQLVEKKDCTTAIPVFLEVLSIEPSVGALFNLAECYKATKKPVAAWARLQEAISLARIKHDARETLARERSAELEESLPKLRVEEKSTDLEIRIDGRVIARSDWGKALRIAPGNHDVVASLQGRRDFAARVIVEGDGSPGIIAIPELRPLDEKPKTRIEVRPVAVAPPTALRTLGIGAIGLGTLSLVAGGVFGFITMGTRDQVDQECPTYPNGCDPARRSKIESLRSDGNATALLSTTFFVAGGILVSAGIPLFIYASKSNAPQRADVRVGPNAMNFSASF